MAAFAPALVLGMVCTLGLVDVRAQGTAGARERAQEPAPVAPASIATTNRFDGDWTIRLDCAPGAGAPVAKETVTDFPASVLNGRLFGSRGQQGAAGSLQVEGTIGPDGDAQFQAHGIAADADDGAKSPSAGAAYSYDVRSHFDEARGTGSRVQGRACNFTSTRR